MHSLAYALRAALRQLQKSPGYSLTIVVTLALGIGATTTIFSLVEGILLRPLAFNASDRLILLGDHVGSGGGTNLPVTAREIETYSKATNAFSSMGAFINIGYELSGEAVPEAVRGARLTTSMFSTLGINPILGRIFTQQEEDGRVRDIEVKVLENACDSKVFLAYTVLTDIGRLPRPIIVRPRAEFRA